MQMSLSIFISYAHEDESLLRELENHLALLRNLGVITAWHDRNISAGTEWEREIDTHLNTAQIILLLISANFLASKYCYSVEMRRAMERHNTGEARVIPVVLRPVYYKDAPFSALQMLPRDGKAVTTWPDLDEAFVNITTEIRKAVKELSIGRFQSLSNLPTPALSQAIVPRGLPRPATLVGRDAELTKLMARLRAGETSGIYALNGMGGVGKTALAAEIVGRLSQEREMFPGGAAWIFCEDLEGPEGLVQIWRQVALALRLEQVIKMTDPETQRIALSDVLIRSPRLLLALDNVEPKLDAEVLLDTLAIPDHTTLLLTARQALLPEKLTSIMLHPLPAGDASQLFIQRLSQVDDARPMKDDSMWIPQIIYTLGGLPLAIELVAAYAGVQHLPLTHILWEIQQDKLEAASFNFDSRRALRSRFHRSWRVLSPQEQHLFASLGLLQGTAFPRQSAVALAVTLRENEPKQSSVSRYSSAKLVVASLVAYALVEPVGQEYMRLHPLLREYAHERLDELKKLDLIVYERLQKSAEQENLHIRDYPISYEGLTGIEADQVWELHREASKVRMEETRTTSLPVASTLMSTHARELLELSIYLEKAGERDRAYERILEGLQYSGAAQDPDIEQVRMRLERSQAKKDPVISLQEKLRGFISVKQGKEAGRTYEVYNKSLRIGRDSESDIFLEETSVSRKHAILLPLNEQNCGLKDEGSTNGTWLNGQLMNKRQFYPLQSGDTIHLGETILIFTKLDFHSNAP